MAVVTWHVSPDTMIEFSQIHDQVVNRLIGQPEAIDKIRSLPDFPMHFNPAVDQLRIIGKPPKPTIIMPGRLN